MSKMKWISGGLVFALGLILIPIGCGSPSHTDLVGAPPLQTVQHVDVERYMGTWYEIARTPNPFQEGCTGTTATYELEADGDVKVYNRCYQGTLDGEVDDATGHAYVADTSTNAKFRVTFFWPFYGDYWIVALDEQDYQWVVVSEPDRDYVWLLARSPQIDDALYQDLLARMEEMQLPVDQLMLTKQREAEAPSQAD